MSEKQIQNKILLKFGAVDYMRIWRVNVGMAYSFHEIRALISLISAGKLIEAIRYSKALNPIKFGQKGHSDIAGIMNDGRGIYIEVKSEKGKPSPEQIYFGNMIQKFNGIYILARDEEIVKNRLILEGYIKNENCVI